MNKKNNERIDDDNKYERVLMINVNKLVCLDEIKKGEGFRIVYQSRDNEEVVIRDV